MCGHGVCFLAAHQIWTPLEYRKSVPYLWVLPLPVVEFRNSLPLALFETRAQIQDLSPTNKFIHLRLQFKTEPQDERAIHPAFTSLVQGTEAATGFGEAAVKKVKSSEQKWLSGCPQYCSKVPVPNNTANSNTSMWWGSAVTVVYHTCVGEGGLYHDNQSCLPVVPAFPL